ncbi:hypothetical protein [Delftia acidovorans]|uniref:hypothetical protein n=1 Tax=Delftia acidovorans TaxID=80866 RepID=UPI000AAD6E06|nr:hypothetical protein [Delftia acidovorans]QQB53564.1 hypothetical protein I6H54_15520 [Delftia acidovorans]
MTIFNSAHLQVLQPWASVIAAFIAASVAIIFGAAQVWIAWQQSKTTRNKLKLDLFDRRLEVYKAASEAIATAIQTNDFTASDERAFFLGIRGSRWLLDAVADDYLRSDLFHAFDRLEKIRLNKGKVKADEHQRLVSEATDAVRKELARLDSMFERFLRIDH